MNTRVIKKQPKLSNQAQKKQKSGVRAHALSKLKRLLDLIRKTLLRKSLLAKSVLLNSVLRKISEGRVKKKVGRKDSKECACNTHTPCKGLRPVDPALRGSRSK